MAKITKGILGEFSGKIGSVIGYKRKGVAIIQSIPTKYSAANRYPVYNPSYNKPWAVYMWPLLSTFQKESFQPYKKYYESVYQAYLRLNKEFFEFNHSRKIYFSYSYANPIPFRIYFEIYLNYTNGSYVFNLYGHDSVYNQTSYLNVKLEVVRGFSIIKTLVSKNIYANSTRLTNGVYSLIGNTDYDLRIYLKDAYSLNECTIAIPNFVFTP